MLFQLQKRKQKRKKKNAETSLSQTCLQSHEKTPPLYNHNHLFSLPFSFPKAFRFPHKTSPNPNSNPLLCSFMAVTHLSLCRNPWLSRQPITRQALVRLFFEYPFKKESCGFQSWFSRRPISQPKFSFISAAFRVVMCFGFCGSGVCLVPEKLSENGNKVVNLNDFGSEFILFYFLFLSFSGIKPIFTL